MPRLKKTIFGLKAFARRVQAGDDSADLRARLQGPGSRRIVERGLFCLQLGLALNHRIELGREGQRTDPLTQTLARTDVDKRIRWREMLAQPGQVQPQRCHHVLRQAVQNLGADIGAVGQQARQVHDRAQT